MKAGSVSPSAERALALEHLWMPYTQWNDLAEEGGPRVLIRGEGCRVWDSEGREYIDGLSGLEACAIGYGRDDVVDAIAEQLRQLPFLDLFRYASRPAVDLAAKLAEITPGPLSKVFFTPGGSEAIEVAIKLARQYHYNAGETARTRIVSRTGAFHGSTFGAMSVDGHTLAGKTHIWEPLPNAPLFFQGPYHYRCEHCASSDACTNDCLGGLRAIISQEGAETIAGVVVDPAATYIGVSPTPPAYLQELREVCSSNGILLIVDEIITGFGRTGRMFCCEYADVVPDIMTMSKGLSSGYLPIGAVITDEIVHERFVGGFNETFAHGQTYGGHPACAAAALASIATIERENLVERAGTLGEYFLSQLATLAEYELVGDVRGVGLLAGVELVADKRTSEQPNPPGSLGAQVRKACREEGLTTLAVYPGDVMLLAPPLVVTEADIDELVSRFGRALMRVQRS